MPAPSEPPRDLADRMVRQALRHPANLRAFLHQAVPELADGFDYDRCRLLDREFPLEDWRRREADLPFEVPYRLGDEELWALVYVLLEHQSAEDPAMPLRLLLLRGPVLGAAVAGVGTAGGPAKGPLRLSPVLPLVLYTGAGPWENNRTLHDMLGEPAEFHGFVPQWGPLFWELGQQTPESLLESGDEWQQVLAVLRAQGQPAPDFERVFVEAMRRLEALASRDHVRWCELMQIVLSWAQARRPVPEREALRAAGLAALIDANRQKEVASMGQTIGEAIWEEGRLKGESTGELGGLAADAPAASGGPVQQRARRGRAAHRELHGPGPLDGCRPAGPQPRQAGAPAAVALQTTGSSRLSSFPQPWAQSFPRKLAKGSGVVPASRLMCFRSNS